MVSWHADAAASLTPQATRRRHGGRKGALEFLLCCRCCQALVNIFSPRARSALCHMAPIGLAASCGVGTSRRQRPALRVGAHTRHPMLSASLTSAGKPVGGDPISPTAASQARKCNGSPPPAPGPRATAPEDGLCLLERCPLGSLPVSKNRHRAISHLRAPATIPIRLRRFPPPPKRSCTSNSAPSQVDTHPTPRQLCGPPAHVSVARLGNPLVPGTFAAVDTASGFILLSRPPHAVSSPHARQNIPSPIPRPHCSRCLCAASTDGPSRASLPARCAAGHAVPLLTPPSAHQALVLRLHPQSTSTHTTRARATPPTAEGRQVVGQLVHAA